MTTPYQKNYQRIYQRRYYWLKRGLPVPEGRPHLSEEEAREHRLASYRKSKAKARARVKAEKELLNHTQSTMASQFDCNTLRQLINNHFKKSLPNIDKIPKPRLLEIIENYNVDLTLESQAKARARVKAEKELLKNDN